MKRAIIFFMLGVSSAMVFSQAPVVSNVCFSQRTDGSLLVDIYYDLSDTDGETKNIMAEASDDDGVTWDLTCASLTGDVGTGISLGTGKHVVWDFYADNPNVSGSDYKVRVTVSEEGTVTGNDGKVYKTVKIGNQWWMAENLQETKYRDGSAIPNVTNAGSWSQSWLIGARCAYDNNEETAVTYGYLYNWFAVTDSRKIAPSGWHVPTYADWTQLEMYLGMSETDVNKTGWRGTDEGGKMKEAGTAHWQSPNTGATNASGLSALPAGWRIPNGAYENYCFRTRFWSSTSPNEGDAWSRELAYNTSAVAMLANHKLHGFSVRCVKD